MKTIENSTFSVESRQRIMDPTVNLLKDGKLKLTSMYVAPDFSATFKYVEPDKLWTSCNWKFNLNDK